MAGEYSTGSVIEYLISNNEGQIKTGKNNKPLKKLIINNKEYYYNKDKQPLSSSLQNKLNQVSNTQGFKRFHLLKKASNTMRGIKTIQKYRIRAGAKTSETFSALKRYANTYSITNIPFKGYKGLTYILWQEKKLTEFLQQAKSMKLLIDVEVIFDKLRQQDEDDDEPIEENIQIKHNIRSRREDILNVGDLKKALENIPKYIELQIENSPLKHSGLKINKINKTERDPVSVGFLHTPNFAAFWPKPRKKKDSGTMCWYHANSSPPYLPPPCRCQAPVQNRKKTSRKDSGTMCGYHANSSPPYPPCRCQAPVPKPKKTSRN